MLAATSSTTYAVSHPSDLYLQTAQAASNNHVKLATTRFQTTSPLNKPFIRFCASGQSPGLSSDCPRADSHGWRYTRIGQGRRQHSTRRPGPPRSVSSEPRPSSRHEGEVAASFVFCATCRCCRCRGWMRRWSMTYSSVMAVLHVD